MINPSIDPSTVYSRIPRPYLNVDKTPLVNAVCLKPCGDHVSKTSAAAFKERCFCGAPVTSQEDDPAFQFYASVIHQNATSEVILSQKNAEILSLKKQLKQQTEEAEKYSQLHQELQNRIKKYVAAVKTVDKSEAAPLPIVEHSAASVSSTSVASSTPMETTPEASQVTSKKSSMQKDIETAVISQVTQESSSTQAPKGITPKPAVTKRKELEKPELSKTAEKTNKAKNDSEAPIKKRKPRAPKDPLNKTLSHANTTSIAKPTAKVLPSQPASTPLKKPDAVSSSEHYPNVKVTQVVVSAASLQNSSATQKGIEGVITTNLSSQTSSFFAAPAPVQVIPSALPAAETPEGIQQRAALKNKVTSVLAWILAKKPV